MALTLKIKKSGGIRVTPLVHRLISRGNAARDAARWDDAAAAYRHALMLAPELYHIHVQHGHALKEAGRPDEADAAYKEAISLRPDDAEVLIQHAHLVARIGGQRAAIRLLARALERHVGHAGLSAALTGLLDQMEIPHPMLLEQALKEGVLAEALASPRPIQTASGTVPQVFDITDLIRHFRHQRLPNGIERVQMEVLRQALERHGESGIGICCFIGARDGWVGVPPSLFHGVVALATTGSDPEDPAWRLARARLFLHLALADDYAMPTGAVLLNLGTSWWAHDYFRHVRNAKASASIRYIPLVYDLIPILAPQYCLPDITLDFYGWVNGALRHADCFMAISHHSRDDLLHVAKRLGQSLTAEQVEVIPLDADFRHTTDLLPSADLARWGLTGAPFALLVSTIEPRKNHALAFDAWSHLLRRHGPDRLPRLVCVGRDGWLNDPVFARLELDPLLAAHVSLIHRVSDEELALLYRSCLFTIYPSLYEGWGLPVTESLSHGRVAIVADNSSLPEAGSGLALLFASGSVDALVTAVEQVVFDNHWREAREAMIAAHFAPRTWAQVAGQVDGAIARLLATTKPTIVEPVVELGSYYRTRVHHDDRRLYPPVGGEDVRIGDGWLWPEPDGCRTSSDGGVVRLRVTGAGKLRLHLRLRGLAAADCPISIVAAGKEVARTVIPAGKTRWLACELTGPDVTFLLRGEATETVDMPNGSRTASVALLGLLPTDPDISPSVLMTAIDQAADRPVVSSEPLWSDAALFHLRK